jgi:hypothetical protein
MSGPPEPCECPGYLASGLASRPAEPFVSGPSAVGGFSVLRVVVLADSRAAWRLWPLLSSGWTNFVPVDLASLSGSVIARTALHVGALSDSKVQP